MNTVAEFLAHIPTARRIYAVDERRPLRKRRPEFGPLYHRIDAETARKHLTTLETDPTAFEFDYLSLDTGNGFRTVYKYHHTRPDGTLYTGAARMNAKQLIAQERRLERHAEQLASTLDAEENPKRREELLAQLDDLDKELAKIAQQHEEDASIF